MQSRRQRITVATVLLALVAVGWAVTAISFAQTPQSRAAAEEALETPKNMDPERAKIWTSPDMLRARAWLYDRISKSAKIKPEEGEKYIKTLENMTPAEMKLWLLKFDEEEEHRQQQTAFWQQHQQALAQQAAAVHRATQQAYQNINQEETAAAQQEQGQLNEQAQARQERQVDNQYVPIGPYPLGPYGYGYPGYGGLHYHYHIYP